MMRLTAAALLGFAVAAAARADESALLPLPADTRGDAAKKTDPVYHRHQRVTGKVGPGPARWRIVAGWKTPDPGVEGTKRAAFNVRGPADLLGVCVEFGDEPPAREPNRFLSAAAGEYDPDGLRVRIDARLTAWSGGGSDVGRDALRFFHGNNGTTEPRFRLVFEPQFRRMFDPNSVVYPVTGHNQPVPHQLKDSKRKRMGAFVRLLNEIGQNCRGRVFWMVEPGDPDPARVVVGWQPHGVPWWADGVTDRKCKLASPMWDEVFEVEALEPPAEWVSAGAAGRAFGRPGPVRTGLVALPAGTCDILAKCVNGVAPVALGREGVVLTAGTAFDVYHLRTEEDGKRRYDRPVRTRGLSDPPPRWTAPFALKAKWTPDEARHLVALSVCSPDVWRRARGPGKPPQAESLRPLFMDPELWACPPVP